MQDSLPLWDNISAQEKRYMHKQIQSHDQLSSQEKSLLYKIMILTFNEEYRRAIPISCQNLVFKFFSATSQNDELIQLCQELIKTYEQYPAENFTLWHDCLSYLLGSSP